MTDLSKTDPPQRAGWYDDPEHAGQLRYFDGIVWTRNVTPRRTPAANAPQSPVATPSLPQSAPPQPLQPPHWAPTGGPGAPAAYGRPTGPTTVDGVPLAGYGSRVAAYVVDAILVNVLALLVGGYFLYQAIEPMLGPLDVAMRTGDPAAINATINLMDVRQLGIYTVIKLVLALVYQLVFLTRWSATAGQLMVGISVRRVERPGVLGWDAASRRAAFLVGVDALTNVPLISLPALVVKLVDLLWPLSDARRQCWHDKVADTQVVQGRQPPRSGLR